MVTSSADMKYPVSSHQALKAGLKLPSGPISLAGCVCVCVKGGVLASQMRYHLALLGKDSQG